MTSRVVVLSLSLAAFFGYVIPIIDFKLNNTFLGATHFPPGAFGVLLVLVLIVNPLFRLLGRSRALKLHFSRNEILTTYITCLFSVLVPGRGSETFFIPNVIASFYYATRDNGWLTLLQPYLKPWMTPALSSNGAYNEKLVAGWYVGNGGVVPWGAWLVPLAAWSSVILALYAMLCCLGVILRAQWGEREALAFPLLRLPLEMTQDVDKPAGSQDGFLRNPLVWIGFGLAAFIELLNGFNGYFPDVPRVSMLLSTGPLFSEAPWNQIGVFTMQVWPIVIGVTYLLTSEVSFSLWFFYLFTRGQMIVAYYMGLAPGTLPEATFTRGYSKNFIFFQEIGAYLAYVTMVMWIGREHYKHVVLRGLGRAGARPGEKDEPLSYPTAFWGFVLSSGFILAWTCAAGVRLDIALVLWSLYLVLAIGLTRVVVEGGLLYAQSGWAPLGPLANLIPGGVGTWLPPSSAVPAAYITGSLMSEMRGFLLPSFVQSFKLAHDRKIKMKPLLALISACVVVSLSTGMWMILKLGYANGGLSMERWWAKIGCLYPTGNAKEAMGLVGGDRGTNWLWMGIGAATTVGIMAGRSRFLWFPFHPIGYIMCAPAAMYSMWFSIFLGWLIKSLITKYGGSDGYRKLIPLFLGVIMGEVTMILFWLVIDGWQGRTGHQLMPG